MGEEKRAEEKRKKEEEDVKGQIVHRQLVKTAECQEHERIIRRIEDAPKQGKEDERYIQKQEDKRTEEDVNAEKTENTQDDPAPILNALQMLQFGLKLNRKAETAVPEEPENSVETPIKDKKAKKKEKKEREKLMELFEDEKKLLEMFESPKKSKSKSKEPSKEKERRSEKVSERDDDVDESKFKFKLKDSKKLRSLTPEQEEYLLKLSKEVDEERKKKQEEERLKEIEE